MAFTSWSVAHPSVPLITAYPRPRHHTSLSLPRTNLLRRVTRGQHVNEGGEAEHPLRRTTKFQWTESIPKDNFATFPDVVAATLESDPDREHHWHQGTQGQRISVAKLPHDQNQGRSYRRPPSLTASTGADPSYLAFEASRPRSTVLASNRARAEGGGLGDGPGSPSAVECSPTMHRLVSKDDYLLARGANPRTGVVTPGSRSVNSTVDPNESLVLSSPGPQNRWRQRGDQWISLDQGQVTPMPTPTPPKDRAPALCQGPFRTPPRSAGAGRGPSVADHALSPLGHERAQSSTFSRPDSRPPPPPKEPAAYLAVPRRRPRGPHSHSLVDEHPSAHDEADESTDTVLRRPRFATDLRSSSAPEPPRRRQVTPYNTEKDLPGLPVPVVLPAPNNAPTPAAPGPFLGPAVSQTREGSPHPLPRSTSGRPTIEKELPCLPTSSGLSPLIKDMWPSDETPSQEPRYSPRRPETSTPQGPRGGNLSYPFVRSARQVHPLPQTRKTSGPAGERPMPVPVYDNPPKRASPTGPRVGRPTAEGPRPMPTQVPPAVPMPMPMTSRTMDDVDPSSSIITTATNMSMWSGVPRPVRVGPRPFMPDPAMVHPGSGRHGFPPRATPASASDIIMNTGMHMNTDAMMAIPLPRTRARALSRPAMPMRMEAVYGVPRRDPYYNRPITTPMTRLPMHTRAGAEEMAREYQLEMGAGLVPPPLKTRAQVTPEPVQRGDIHAPGGGETDGANGLGLMRKCSRCDHGFVDVRLRGTDGAIRISDRRPGDAAANGANSQAHPTGSPLPGVPEASGEDEATQSDGAPASPTPVDERDHSLCCPDCCKDEDCHEGCVGHSSPRSTPSPTKSMWSSDAPSLDTSVSSVDGWDEAHDAKAGEKPRWNGLAFVRQALRLSPTEGISRTGTELSTDTRASSVATGRAVDGSAHSRPRSPASPLKKSPGGFPSPDRASRDALAAALTATGARRPQTPAQGLHRRQRSFSSPVAGSTLASRARHGDHSQKGVGGPRLRVATPVGLFNSCAGVPGSRTVSGASVATMELAMPGLGALGAGAAGEMLLVPFEATKMWLRKNPQVMSLGWAVLERGWQMGQIMTTTGWRLWAIIFVYSKTGKLKVRMRKGETAGGFVVDCARSAVYLLIFAAVSVFLVRVLRVILGVVGIVGSLFKAVVWVLKHTLGLGMIR